MAPEEPQRRPGKRDPALVPLSHEHHRALVEALRLKRVTEEDGHAAVRAFLAFWDEDGRAHFAMEEELILPAFARHADSDDETIVEVLVQHVEIRRRVADLERPSGTAVPELVALGELLERHVRLEERVLFPRMEEALPAEELRALGTAIEAAEAHSG
jgi:hemerythrin-like domain-containing protein